MAATVLAPLVPRMGLKDFHFAASVPGVPLLTPGSSLDPLLSSPYTQTPAFLSVHQVVFCICLPMTSVLH